MRYVRHPNRYADISVCDFIINMKKKINTFIDDLYKQKGKLIMRKKNVIYVGGRTNGKI